MIAHGDYFDGNSARVVPVTVRYEEEGRSLVIQGEGVAAAFPLDATRISDPLGRTRRSVDFPDGSRLETEDGPALDAWQKRAGRGDTGRFVHLLESKWRYGLLALAVIAAAAFGFYFYAIPFVAKIVAERIPLPVAKMMSDQAYPVLEKMLRLEASELPAERQAAIQRGFGDIAQAFGPWPFELRIHKAACGANAFAMPGGRIILTDALVEIAESDEEIFSVLAHEAAHVVQRHGLRSILQDTGAFLVVTALFGDLTSATSLGIALPSMLAESGYSREFERQADAAAAEYAIGEEWGVKPLKDILRRLTKEHGEMAGMSWVSSHPETEARVQALEQREKRGGGL